MGRLAIILFCLITSCRHYGQTAPVFQISQIIVKDSAQWKTARDFTRRDSSFFEDSNYVVRKTCSGEWGGSVWFKNKKTGKEYSCEATCAISVNKLNGKYIVTCSLAHMSGSTEIFQIDDPSALAVFKQPKPYKKKGKESMYHFGDFESSSKQGCTYLIDTPGILAITSFPYKGRMFHIFADRKKTFIATIENGKFLVADTLSNTSLWSYDPENFVTSNGHYLSFFNHGDVNGYLDIYDDKIKLVRYK